MYNDADLLKIENYNINGDLTAENLVDEGDEPDHEAVTAFILGKGG